MGRADDALREALDARVPQVDSRGILRELVDFDRALAYQAAAALELKGGEALPSADLLYFLGLSLIHADRRRDEDGRRILKKALELDPGSPLAASAWFQVGVASNRLLDPEAEHAAYGASLELEWREGARATTLLNRAESSMSMGDLRAAREGYLDALEGAAASQSVVYALVSWGLAVAYARDDDLPNALKYAWKATEMHFPMVDPARGVVQAHAIDLPSVYYTPAQEIFFYRALGDMAIAEHTNDVAKRRNVLTRALENWDQYLAFAKRDGDRWIQNAEFHRRWCSRRLAEAGVKQPSESAESKEGSGSRSRRPRPPRAPE